MPEILVGTHVGCRVFSEAGEGPVELAGRRVSSLVADLETCLAVIDDREIWRRERGGKWSKVATASVSLQSLAIAGDTIFCGAMEEAVMLRVTANGEPERLQGFDSAPGRSEWFAGGPPLEVRSLTATVDGTAVLAAVHVGGIPRSVDRGETWAPTVPVAFDVHEVRSHPTLPNLVAAAAAVGLCVSHNGGAEWEVISKGLALTYSLALAVLENDILFGISDGPFAKRSQLWRWRIGDTHVEQVRDGLPEWLDGKLDTAQIAAKNERAAMVDGGGNLWFSKAGPSGWERIATGLPYALGLVVL